MVTEIPEGTFICAIDAEGFALTDPVPYHPADRSSDLMQMYESAWVAGFRLTLPDGSSVDIPWPDAQTVDESVELSPPALLAQSRVSLN